jgi:hypothetical protein
MLSTVVFGLLALATGGSCHPASKLVKGKAFDRLAIIWLENTDYDLAAGDRKCITKLVDRWKYTANLEYSEPGIPREERHLAVEPLRCHPPFHAQLRRCDLRRLLWHQPR